MILIPKYTYYNKDFFFQITHAFQPSTLRIMILAISHNYTFLGIF